MATAETAVSKQQIHFLEDTLQNVSKFFHQAKTNLKIVQDAENQRKEDQTCGSFGGCGASQTGRHHVHRRLQPQKHLQRAQEAHW